MGVLEELKKDTSSTDSGDFCRICHCGAEVEELISPCHCSGSLGFIHQTCLQEWLGGTNKKTCELCHYEFKLHATMRPLNKWRLLALSRYERRKIVCSVTFHMLAITCVIWSIWVLLQRLIQEAQLSELGWAFWTKVVVVIIGFVGGLSFVFAQVKMYYNLFRRWRSFNKIILICDRNSLEEQKMCPLVTDHGAPTGKIQSPVLHVWWRSKPWWRSIICWVIVWLDSDAVSDHVRSGWVNVKKSWNHANHINMTFLKYYL